MKIRSNLIATTILFVSRSSRRSLFTLTIHKNKTQSPVCDVKSEVKSSNELTINFQTRANKSSSSNLLMNHSNNLESISNSHKRHERQERGEYQKLTYPSHIPSIWNSRKCWISLFLIKYMTKQQNLIKIWKLQNRNNKRRPWYSVSFLFLKKY
jgi:hypothetical protein